jgi:hypothetical protein
VKNSLLGGESQIKKNGEGPIYRPARYKVGEEKRRLSFMSMDLYIQRVRGEERQDVSEY